MVGRVLFYSRLWFSFNQKGDANVLLVGRNVLDGILERIIFLSKLLELGDKLSGGHSVMMFLFPKNHSRKRAPLTHPSIGDGVNPFVIGDEDAAELR
jgi:hypothetical protein